MKFWFWVIGAVVSFPLAASDWGLIDQPQTFPWSVGLAPSSLEEAGGLDPGRTRVQASALWFNTYRQYGLGAAMTQLVDLEGVATTATAAWAPLVGWELRAQVQGWALGTGTLDPFLAAFHSWLGVPNQGREQSPSNGYRNLVRGVLDAPPGSGLTQASLASRWFSGPWSSSVWTKVPVPRHDGWSWSHRWGAGGALGWGDRWPFEPGFQLRAGTTLAWVLVAADDSLGPTTPWAVQTGGYLVVETPWGPRLVGQGVWTSVPRSGEGYLAQPAGLLTVGFQWPLDDHWAVEGALGEEFFTWSTLEVGFQAGVVWKP